MKLFLKIALFTLVVPGAVAVLVPLLLGGDRTVAGGAWLGLAVCLFALGVALYVRAVWDFAVLGKGTPAPIDAPKRLVVRGIYRYSRNPLYIAMLTLIAGWAAFFGTAVLLAYAAGSVRPVLAVHPLPRRAAPRARVRRGICGVHATGWPLAAPAAAPVGRPDPFAPSVNSGQALSLSKGVSLARRRGVVRQAHHERSQPFRIRTCVTKARGHHC